MMMTENSNSSLKGDWSVLLIGGSSGSGKTIAAEQLGRRFTAGAAAQSSDATGGNRCTLLL